MNGRIVVNPDVFRDGRDAKGVAWNEGLRAWMEVNNVKLVAEPTEDQRRFFSGTAYERDEVQLRRTIAARIITHDTSAGGATEDQIEECAELLRRIRLGKGLSQEDRNVIGVLLNNLPEPSDDKPKAPDQDDNANTGGMADMASRPDNDANTRKSGVPVKEPTSMEETENRTQPVVL